MKAIVTRGCIVPWAQARKAGSHLRPRLIRALSVEPSKPQLIFDAPPPLKSRHCRYETFDMDSVGTVARVYWNECFHQEVLLHVQSWSLFGFCWQGFHFVWTMLPAGLAKILGKHGHGHQLTTCWNYTMKKCHHVFNTFKESGRA